MSLCSSLPSRMWLSLPLMGISEKEKPTDKLLKDVAKMEKPSLLQRFIRSRELIRKKDEVRGEGLCLKRGEGDWRVGAAHVHLLLCDIWNSVRGCFSLDIQYVYREVNGTAE